MAGEALGYIVDTNVLSNRNDVDRNPKSAEWLLRFAGQVRVSVVTIAEMHRGLLLLEAKAVATLDRAAKSRLNAAARSKRAWYDELLVRFADRIEPIDLQVAQKWAEVSVRFPSLRDADKAIAATAIAKDYGVATRNLGDFQQGGVPLVDPFDPGTWNNDWDDDPLAPLLRS